ncbi:MAG: SAM-dependent methyltransferase [Bacteroidales bacterium]|nr:SAM-dependent methyltransferase [Bacteroidales bacterium]
MMKKKLTIIAVAAVMALVATSCKEAQKESVPAAEAITESSVDPVAALCLEETSRNPIEILEKLMSQPDCPMHGPTHHVLVGAALLTAYNNSLPDSSKLDLKEALAEMRERGKQVPGGACGYMGACGASISTGIFLSIVTRNTPFSTDTWRLCNLCTARALEQVAENGGPRCCKRDSYLSVLTAIDFVKENLGVEMVKPEVHCTRSQINEQCIGKKCPFSPQE